MSSPIYAVRNGNAVTGVLWDNEKLGKVFVLMNNIDANFDLEIIDCANNEIVKHVDLRDLLLEVLPYKE